LPQYWERAVIAEHQYRAILVNGWSRQAFHNWFHICNFRHSPFSGNFYAKADTKKHDETVPLQRHGSAKTHTNKYPLPPVVLL